jgi:transposase-like protein
MSNLVGQGSKYSDDDRRRAVVEYCVLGNTKKVAEVTGIPRTTINDWRKTDWWDEETIKARHETNNRILAQNLQVATEAGERVLDSLENGDEKLVWDKAKGEHVIKRVKPSGKEAAVISGIAQDKARVQMSLPTSISAKGPDLEALAEKFKQMARDYKEEQKSIDGECEEIE